MGDRKNNGSGGGGGFNFWYAGLAVAGLGGLYFKFNFKKENSLTIQEDNVTGDNNSNFNNTIDLSKKIEAKIETKE